MTKVIRDLPFDDYLKIDAVNSSRLKLIDKSPKYYLENPNHGETRSQGLGTLAHTATLQPHLLKTEYTCAPDSIEEHRGRLPYKEFIKSHSGVVVVKRKEMQRALDIAQDVLVQQTRLFPPDGSNETELTVTWTDPETGLPCKIRIDNFTPGVGITDLKTDRDISLDKFPFAAKRYQYYAQSAFYRRGVLAAQAEGLLPPTGDDCECYIIAAETGPVRDHCRYRVPDAEITYFDQVISERLRRVAECTESNDWPGLSGMGTVDLHYPGRMDVGDFEDENGLEELDWT